MRIRFLDTLPVGQVLSVGGKAESLAAMMRAGLPVPPAFALTTSAWKEWIDSGSGPEIPEPLRAELLAAYAELGNGSVAVRSSATDEDGSEASFAGQQETILGVVGDDALVAAVVRCWRSLQSERARAYREKQKVSESSAGMAVVVQRLIEADTAGVLFTEDPTASEPGQILIEASWGLGESVVSGRVQPDRFRLDRASLAVTMAEPGLKKTSCRGSEVVDVPESNWKTLCVSPEELTRLGRLGLRTEEYYGSPRDIEWAHAGGEFWLLQARPITTAGFAEREVVRGNEIARVASLSKAQGVPGVWVRYNLTEVLPEPTPMTWDIVTRLLSGGGGSGKMYRDFGFDPAPDTADISSYDLIAGRPYLNLVREPRMQSAKPASRYPLEAYRADPSRAIEPKMETDLGSGFGAIFRTIGALWKLVRTARKIQRAVADFAIRWENEYLPAWDRTVADWQATDLSGLSPQDLLARLDAQVDATLVEFASKSLQPTLLAQFCIDSLMQPLKKPSGEAGAKAAVVRLTRGVKPDDRANLADAVVRLGAGKLLEADFLAGFGHRGNREMELSEPRWSETGVAALMGRGAAVPHSESDFDPLREWEAIGAEAGLPAFQIAHLAKTVTRMRVYLALREAGKHHLMRGYAQIRRTLLEIDRRYSLSGGVFFLTRGELPALIAGEDFAAKIAASKKRRLLALSLEVPTVLRDEDASRIGKPQPLPVGATTRTGVGLSAGVVEAPALVLSEPTSTPELTSGYILVCPSTDPAWVPLFVSAKGLVMESGGVLSHGAIVAREFGLPAVAGLPDIHRTIRTGQMLRIDGTTGTVSLL